MEPGRASLGVEEKLMSSRREGVVAAVFLSVLTCAMGIGLAPYQISSTPGTVSTSTLTGVPFPDVGVHPILTVVDDRQPRLAPVCAVCRRDGSSPVPLGAAWLLDVAVYGHPRLAVHTACLLRLLTKFGDDGEPAKNRTLNVYMDVWPGANCGVTLPVRGIHGTCSLDLINNTSRVLRVTVEPRPDGVSQ